MQITGIGATATWKNLAHRTLASLEATTTPGRRFAHGTLQEVAVLAALALVALHLVNTVVLRTNVLSLPGLSWPVATLEATAATAYFYGSLSRLWRGAVALAFGLPALIAGVAMYATHISQVGFTRDDYTGIPMLVAGAVLAGIGLTNLVRAVKSWWRRLLLIPVGLLFSIYVLAPVSLGVAFTNIPRLPISSTNTPAAYGFAYEDVSFTTADGVKLTGWYIPSKNRAAVITVHGAFRGRDRTMEHAAVLAGHGYGVLMLDLEGYGNSEGRANALGWVGARDVHAAAAYLQSRPEIDADKIGGLGLSMGGEVLLQAAGESTALKAVVAEGGSGRTHDDVAETAGVDGKLVGVPIQWMISTTMSIVTGEPTPPPLTEMVQQIGPRHVLLISADKPEERRMNRLFHELGGPTFEHWEAPSSKHMGALELHPDEYEQRVIGFFDATFFPDALP